MTKVSYPDDVPTVPCTTCRRPTTYTGTQLCNGCWEVQHRLADYLAGGARAVAFVKKALKQALKEAKRGS